MLLKLYFEFAALHHLGVLQLYFGDFITLSDYWILTE